MLILPNIDFTKLYSTLNVLSRKTNKSLKKGRNKNIVQETWLRESFYNRTSSKPTQENFASNICVKGPKIFSMYALMYDSE